jgi:Pyruvate/2-oxoacid:ferredoxin oxidoreductase delta subunit
MESSWPMHYVCTHEEAQDLVAAHDQYWLANCGCRESTGHCQRSRTDVCLQFTDGPSSGSDLHEIPGLEVEELLQEADTHHLVARPFRSTSRKEQVEGICFCCDDCCGYFRNPQDVCDKGSLIERTDTARCTQCGACIDVCYFQARTMPGPLVVSSDRCYGCGLCRSVCPEECITMVKRAA